MEDDSPAGRPWPSKGRGADDDELTTNYRTYLNNPLIELAVKQKSLMQ